MFEFFFVIIEFEILSRMAKCEIDTLANSKINICLFLKLSFFLTKTISKDIYIYSVP